MASTAANRTIRLEGPIFDPDVIENLRRALSESVREVGDEGEGILMGFIAAKGFEKSGRFLRSVTSEPAMQSPNYPDASVLKVTDDWKHNGPGRPTKTWFEEGKRNGVRLRKGSWGFKNTAARLKTFNFDEMFGERIRRALG